MNRLKICTHISWTIVGRLWASAHLRHPVPGPSLSSQSTAHAATKQCENPATPYITASAARESAEHGVVWMGTDGTGHTSSFSLRRTKSVALHSIHPLTLIRGSCAQITLIKSRPADSRRLYRTRPSSPSRRTQFARECAAH